MTFFTLLLIDKFLTKRNDFVSTLNLPQNVKQTENKQRFHALNGMLNSSVVF